MKIFLLLLIILSSLSSYSQVTILVDEVPANTPKEDNLYLAGSFNEWDPQHDQHRLIKQEDGSYALTLPFEIHSGEYKITRGSWKAVESSVDGYPITNRRFTREENNKRTLHVKVKGWEDLANKYSVTFIIKKLPKETPHDAIYVVGNFNNWNPGDPGYKLTANEDGTYSKTIYTNRDTVVYKFTRGNWSSVESKSSGRFLLNRSYILKGEEPVVLENEISGWEDTVVGTARLYMVILLMAAFQGLFLIVAIYGLPNKNKEANFMLALVILAIAFSLFGRVTSYERIVYEFQPKLLLLSDISYFLIGPLFYLYIQKLLTIQVKSFVKKWLHFLPFIIHLCVYIPLLLTDQEEFKHNVIDQNYYELFVTVGGLALLYNIFYLIKCSRVLKNYKAEMNNTQSFESNLGYLSNFIKLGFACLALWGFSYIVHFPAFFMDINPKVISETSTDLLWVAFSIFTYFLGYYTMTQPEVFRLVKEDEEVIHQETQKYAVLPDETLELLKEELDTLMAKEKPYLNPKLSLQELADMLNSNIHSTSKLINEGYHKNFHDFVNEFRIEEFKKYALSGKFKNFTFLSIAFEVGFSSKTTFNRAFKKSTGVTPREYFNEVQENQLQVQ